jgi:hypothetical protein
MIRRLAISLAALVAALILCPDARAQKSDDQPSLVAQVPTPTPSYIPWYYSSPSPWPSPIPSANAAINGAFGAGNIYNTGSGGFGSSSGIDILDTNECNFLCFGARGVASHHVLAYGNDYQSASYTTQGAPDDCGSSCPGDVANQIYSITLQASPETNNGYIVAVDGKGDLGVYNNIVAGAAVIAGAGDSTPEPSPSPGSLVSYTGSGKGDVLLGSSGNYAKCDYGETTSDILTCNQQLAVTNGVQPNGSSGGYAAETFPLGVSERHPQILSGSCTFTGISGACTFPNSFAFADTTYTCTITAQSSTPVADSYVNTSTTQITIHVPSLATWTFSYMCLS